MKSWILNHGLPIVVVIILLVAISYLMTAKDKLRCVPNKKATATTTCYGCTPPKITVYYDDGSSETIDYKKGDKP